MMKKFFNLLVTVFVAVFVFAGCDPVDRGSPEDNLIEDHMVLGAFAAYLTGAEPFNISVEETGTPGRFRVTGTVRAGRTWDGNTVHRMGFNIFANPEDHLYHFINVNGYRITFEFPSGSFNPSGLWTFVLRNEPDWDEGGRLEHTIPGPQTLPVLGSVGSVPFNYHSLHVMLHFNEANVDQEYTFYISNVGVYGDGIGAGIEIPRIHGNSRLVDATYTLDQQAAPLIVIPYWTANRDVYNIRWYRNTTNSTTGATLVESGTFEELVDLELTGNLEGGVPFTPSTETQGTFWYYVVVEFEGRTATSRFVRITVNP